MVLARYYSLKFIPSGKLEGKILFGYSAYHLLNPFYKLNALEVFPSERDGTPLEAHTKAKNMSVYANIGKSYCGVGEVE